MLEDFKLKNLKTMTISELESLASEIRNKIIDVTSKNGGHLSSNLGMVELTIALHKVFDAPFDKIIFDVSHQTYAHKILTGRYKEFDTLRQFNGLSGFAKYSESIYDSFEGGHSSTSISAGLGFLEAKKIYPKKIGQIIAVIGDASISNGISFEALNYLGAHPEEKMIIIINDNDMSISKNVGMISKRYNSIRVKSSIRFLRKITPIKLKHALQYYAYKMDLFTSLGFKYFEGIDGHDFNELFKYLQYAKNIDKTIILHVKTIKGKGFAPAENDKLGLWHGVGPFNKELGIQNSSNSLTFGEGLGNYLIEKFKENNSEPIKVLTPATLLGSGLSRLAQEYPQKVIDVGIAEENALVMASAMALEGVIPIIFIYATFLQRAFDELIHDIARPNLHVILCVDRAGIVSCDGDTHQGIYDMAYFNAIPGLKILQPTTIEDARSMLDYAIKSLNCPVIIRYPKGKAPESGCYFTNNLRWIKILDGHNYCISYGPDIIEIKNKIIENKLKIGLVNAVVTTPLDELFINNLAPGTMLYIYEQVISNSCLASQLLMYINSHNLNIKVVSISLNNIYLGAGNIEELKKDNKITIEDLISVIKDGENVC